MHAFVTGASGFLGRRVVARLRERGDRVVALVRPERDATDLIELGAEIVRGDLAEPQALAEEAARADVVYHVGARVVSHGDWDEFERVNARATEVLMDAAFGGKARRFVHVSSLGIFELDRDGMTCSEETPYDSEPLLRGHYTRSKMHADRIARAAQRVGRPVVVVRPGQIYGHDHPQQPVFLGRVNKFLTSSLLLVVSKPSYKTPVVYVENAADAVVLAGTVEGVDGQSFNVIDDPDLSQRDYFRELARVRKGGLRVLYVPVALFLPAVAVVDRLHRLLKRRPWAAGYGLRRSGRSVRYATDAARRSLGWQPRVPLGDALREALSAGE